ncbi:Crp/Fnr family transcriptional regulator [Olivibacter domesticus]|uniref:cAMP-binding domain of CRP or a regulatory subunit of cAMP-dependent protein kinases n=1 Tax=Olivibacter domesticus TaxID=407022 RepID=A0A1H7MNH1_OLID1|nr:cAMP-binding domain of CRP or a regulatory subunit of cAMP-dependent protein kinases [Olivibacter domesticus]
MFNFQQYLQKHTPINVNQFEILRKNLISKSLKKGKVLLNEGEKTNVSYFVSKGLLRAYTLDLNGKEHIIQFAPEDWWIGDRNSVYFNEPAVFNIDVLEDAEVVVITKAFMEQALDICPDFGKYNIYLLHNSIRHMQNRINKLLAATAEERYLDFIKLYPDLTLRIPQMMIASYLGVTPESLSRVRKALAQKHFRPNS